MSSPVEEPLKEQVVKGEIDSLETKARYLGYLGRLRTALVASSRYLAYTSDVGEAFRPIAHPAIVTAAYGISWAYLGLDVGYEGYKAHHAGEVNSSKTQRSSDVTEPYYRITPQLQPQLSREVYSNH